MNGWLRALWFVGVTVALPAWVHWHQVIGQFDMAAFAEMSETRFLGELALVSVLLFAVSVLPGSLWLGRRRRRGAGRHDGPRDGRRDGWIMAIVSAAAVMVALHLNLTAYAGFYGHTWARWEPTFGLFLPHWPWLLAAVSLTVALELAGAARRRRSDLLAADHAPSHRRGP